MAEDLFRGISSTSVPGDMWKPQTPFERHLAAANLWMRLTEKGNPPSEDETVDSEEKVAAISPGVAGAAVGATTLGVIQALRKYVEAIPRQGGLSRGQLAATAKFNLQQEHEQNEGPSLLRTIRKQWAGLKKDLADKESKNPVLSAALHAAPAVLIGGVGGHYLGRQLDD